MGRRSYNNIVEAVNFSKVLREIFGFSMYVVEMTQNKLIIAKFSWLAMCSFILWYCFYFFCTYKVHVKDQTLIRSFFNTKLLRYGDDCERFTSFVFVLFAMVKIPYNVNNTVRFLEFIVHIDKELQTLGVLIDYKKDAYLAVIITIGQIIIYSVRLLCIWIIYLTRNIPVPAERMYQMVFSDSLTLVAMSYFAYFLMILRYRFMYLNFVLEGVKLQKTWENTIFVRSKMSGSTKSENLQQQRLSQKVKACSAIHGKLYQVVSLINKMHGILLALTMFVSTLSIILYMFYFMEVVADGLFHNPSKYTHFIIFATLQILYSTGIVIFVVTLAESVMNQAKVTIFITNEIIYRDISQSVTSEGMQLSLQIFHQKPEFTANGLYHINYGLVQEGSRAVFTYLVILLQFVTKS